MSNTVTNGRSLAEILSDMKHEIQDFAQTRSELLKREVLEKTSVLKAAIPLAVVAGLFLTTAFLMFSLALAALIATGFGDNPYRWFFACLGVAILWALSGTLAFYGAKRRLSQQSMVPQKTLEVLSGDKVWLQNQARKAL